MKLTKQGVRCENCWGSGRRGLTTIERNTLQAVGTEWSSTDAISRRLIDVQGYATKGPALCNRLIDLYRLELVERRARDGKSYEWRVP